MQNIQQRLFGYKINKFAWLETLVVAALSLLVWYMVEEPSSLQASQSVFLWPVLGPLLIALRYGFAKGFVCALVTVLGFLFMSEVLFDSLQFSLSSAVGLCLCAMCAGEFHDLWYKNTEKYKLNHDYMARKLNSFTQNYHLLKVSHDQLEQKIASDTVNLRSSMQALQMIAAKHPNYELANLADPFLDIFRDTGGVELAGIYKVENNCIVPKPLSKLGNQHAYDANDPMLLDMLKTKKLASIAKAVTPEEHQSRYQLCIPLTDTNGQLQAVILAEKVKFFMLTKINIALMSVLANYAADLISPESSTPSLAPSQGSLFRQYLARALENMEQFGTDSSIIICIDHSGKYEKSLKHAVDYRRGADVYWNCQHKTYGGEAMPALAVLLPLTELVDAQAYVLRLEKILESQLGQHSKNIDILGPLSLHQNWDRIQELLQDLGA